MRQDTDLAAILKKYVAVEDEVVARLAADLEALPSSGDETRHAAKQRVLHAVELHAQADILVEEAVARFREDMYFFAKRLADEELEPGIVTPAHVRQAQVLMARRRRSYGWGDGALAVGGLLLGSAGPHVLAIVEGTTAASPILFVGGIIGALILGMGIVEKAKS